MSNLNGPVKDETDATFEWIKEALAEVDGRQLGKCRLVDFMANLIQGNFDKSTLQLHYTIIKDTLLRDERYK